MKKIKKGDEVIVIAGKDKGKRGMVLTVLDDYLLVENINMVKKHVRANPQQGERGGIIDKNKPVHCSNVMLYDPNKKKGSRVGIRLSDANERVRYFKASTELVEVS
ncbi:MAG: 50S ribosomal protein L24 [uncultured bacterium]|nr:MAG: 50S ribosomal protein L24 [uncultured bacterium]OGT58583.1 MAG: 50S ribosomal protein L24 [Gammaproteobacteria bacterium RIFCSPHIGHO2_12_FULL_42_10]